VERILVVDDEVEVCSVLNEFFSSRGYEVYTALDGVSAINKVKEVRPHIVLLDIIMPGMGGIDTLKKIKKIDPKIGVIMITAVADHELAKRAIDIGAYSYITKPLDLNYIETVVMVKILDFLN
jgi:DNA-binding NtrC family response regulator